MLEGQENLQRHSGVYQAPKLTPPGDGSGRELSEVEMFAILEERGYRKDDILRLDPWWILNVIFYPRTKDGGFVEKIMASSEAQMTPFERFQFGCRRRGMTDAEIETIWEADIKRQESEEAERTSHAKRPTSNGKC
jgi:hypothetical protein